MSAKSVIFRLVKYYNIFQRDYYDSVTIMHDNSTNYVMVNCDGCESSTVAINYGQPMIITKVAVDHPNCDFQCDYQV